MNKRIDKCEMDRRNTETKFMDELTNVGTQREYIRERIRQQQEALDKFTTMSSDLISKMQDNVCLV